MKLIYNIYSTCYKFAMCFPSPYPGGRPFFEGNEVFATCGFMVGPILMTLLSVDNMCEFFVDYSLFKWSLQVFGAKCIKYIATIVLFLPTYLFFSYHDRHEWVLDNYGGLFPSIHPFLSYWLVVILCAIPAILISLIPSFLS